MPVDSNALNRHARVQVELDPATVAAQAANAAPEGQVFYNIWYNRWSGGDGPRKRFYEQSFEKAEHRCLVSKDAGLTRGAERGSSLKFGGMWFCLNFARGCCPYGYDCDFLHRVPVASDPEDTFKDCFGRERHRDERADMGGVGSFENENRTLYVGHIARNHEMDTALRQHFSEWGTIESVRVLAAKGVGFVKYTKRANAEFAKEAMHRQSLNEREVLNVRWATEDPNPALLDMRRTLRQEDDDRYSRKRLRYEPNEAQRQAQAIEEMDQQELEALALEQIALAQETQNMLGASAFRAPTHALATSQDGVSDDVGASKGKPTGLQKQVEQDTKSSIARGTEHGTRLPLASAPESVNEGNASNTVFRVLPVDETYANKASRLMNQTEHELWHLHKQTLGNISAYRRLGRASGKLAMPDSQSPQKALSGQGTGSNGALMPGAASLVSYSDSE